MEIIFGYSWFDLLRYNRTVCGTNDKSNNPVKPRHNSAVPGYPSGFVWLKQRGHERSGLMR